MCSAEEKRAAAEKLEQERQQAMAAARQCTDILLEGQQQGDHQHGSMGMYELMEGKEVNGTTTRRTAPPPVRKCV